MANLSGFFLPFVALFGPIWALLDHFKQKLIFFLWSTSAKPYFTSHVTWEPPCSLGVLLPLWSLFDHSLQNVLLPTLHRRENKWRPLSSNHLFHLSDIGNSSDKQRHIKTYSWPEGLLSSSHDLGRLTGLPPASSVFNILSYPSLPEGLFGSLAHRLMHCTMVPLSTGMLL